MRIEGKVGVMRNSRCPAASLKAPTFDRFSAGSADLGGIAQEVIVKILEPLVLGSGYASASAIQLVETK